MDEWYTPPEWVDRARNAMGTIDLDPASCEVAQQTVRASKWYDKAVNGLRHPWAGNVWLNPPYSRGTIDRFVDKLVFELDAIEQGIVLTDNRTDTDWAQDLLYAADAVAFTRGRIRFYNAHGIIPGSPQNGSAFFYFGKRVAAFRAAFSRSCTVFDRARRR